MVDMKYILIAVAIVLVIWKMSLLPIHQFVPSIVESTLESVLGTPTHMNTMPAQIVSVATPPPLATGACPAAGGKCEDLVTDPQCGVCTSACEWMDNKCRSRELTPQEQSSP